MVKSEIVKRLKRYFDVRELVCPHVYSKLGERSWGVLSTEILHTLLVLREDIVKAEMVVNTYHSGGNKTQRGCRCNLCNLVSYKTKIGICYASAHTRYNAIDFHCNGISSQKLRDRIDDNENLLPYPVRLEDNVSWVHIDCDDYLSGKKVYHFNA